MKYDDILSALQQASGFDLYRLRAMLDRVLADPKWTLAVRRQLHQGQEGDEGKRIEEVGPQPAV